MSIDPILSAGTVERLAPRVIQLKSFWLLGVDGAVSVLGYFVDRDGNRVGDPLSLTINAFTAGNSTPLRLTVSFPEGAKGALIYLSGDVYFDTQDPSIATAPSAFSTASEWGPRIVADPEYNILGLVG